jgi:hypothetical protein
MRLAMDATRSPTGTSPIAVESTGTMELEPNTTLAELQDVQLPGILRNEGNGAAARAISGQG